MGTDMGGLEPDDQLFLFLQSIGYIPPMPLWEYQQKKREMNERIKASNAAEEGAKK